MKTLRDREESVLDDEHRKDAVNALVLIRPHGNITREDLVGVLLEVFQDQINEENRLEDLSRNGVMVRGIRLVPGIRGTITDAMEKLDPQIATILAHEYGGRVKVLPVRMIRRGFD